MKIIEKFLMAKTGAPEECEDIIFVNQWFAAVIDGATARNDQRYYGKRTGLMAAILVQEVFESLTPKASLEDTLGILERRFMEFYETNNIDYEDNSQLLTASAVLYSNYYRQVWMIGDCRCRLGGVVHDNPNGIDDFVASARSFINQAEVLNGRSLDWIAQNDPGAEFIRGLLVKQFTFQNSVNKETGTYSYVAIDGRKMQVDKVKVLTVAQDTQEIILASDGYPVLAETLALSEKALLEMLESDPLCIYCNKGVKGIKQGFVSYDDRAYLRIIVQ